MVVGENLQNIRQPPIRGDGGPGDACVKISCGVSRVGKTAELKSGFSMLRANDKVHTIELTVSPRFFIITTPSYAVLNLCLIYPQTTSDIANHTSLIRLPPNRPGLRMRKNVRLSIHHSLEKIQKTIYP